MFPLSLTRLVFLSCPFIWKGSLFSSSPVSHSLFFSLWQRRGLWCLFTEVIDVTCTPSFPHLDWTSLCCFPLCASLSSYSWSNIFLLLAVWLCPRLSLSVCVPLFWHLHAVKDRHKTAQALAASAKAQNMLWWHVTQTSKHLANLVHESQSQSLRSGSSIVRDSKYFKWSKLCAWKHLKTEVVYLTTDSLCQGTKSPT